MKGFIQTKLPEKKIDDMHDFREDDDQPFSDLNRDSFFDYEKFTQNHNYEIGLNLLERNLNDSSKGSIPPIEHYKNIISSYENKDNAKLKKSLDNYADYLSKNGMNNIEEFEQSPMEKTLVSLCESRDPNLSQISFYIITLLQSKGPNFPSFCIQPDFLQFCFKFLNNIFSPVLYYSLVAINNICIQSQEYRDIVIDRIPLDTISSLFKHFDVNISEVSIDLVCSYLKYPVNEESYTKFVDIAKEALLTKNSIFHRSGFWILVRLLRHCPALVDAIMTRDILKRANDIFYDEDSDGIIPGLIFISYVYEFNKEIPNFNYAGILEVLASPPSCICQRQAYKTIQKIIYRRPDLISKFIRFGLIVQASLAIENAKFSDKIQIGLITCNALLNDMDSTCENVMEFESIAFFLQLIEIDDTVLTRISLDCIYRIFNYAESLGIVKKIMRKFNQNDGPFMIGRLVHEEDEQTATMAQSFIDHFLSNEDDNNGDDDDDEVNNYNDDSVRNDDDNGWN